VANLLATDIAFIIVQSISEYLITFYLVDINSNSTGNALKWSVLLLFTMLRLMTIQLPITLAAERAIFIGFPFHHRSTMTTKTVIGILVTMWVLSTILAIILTVNVPVDIV